MATREWAFRRKLRRDEIVTATGDKKRRCPWLRTDVLPQDLQFQECHPSLRGRNISFLIACRVKNRELYAKLDLF